MQKRLTALAMMALTLLILTSAYMGSDTLAQDTTRTYPIVDTGQVHCFADQAVINCGQAFVGQDAEYAGLQPAYQDNGDGTVTDLNTGLMWQQDPGDKTSQPEAAARADAFNLAGYDDWRLPTIKELYSLILFSGVDASAASSGGSDGLTPFIDDSVFVFQYGDESGAARVIDSQWTTSSVYGATVMGGRECFFGVNFADGRIKCYPLQGGGNAGYFTLYVRGNPAYGINAFTDNGDGTVSDAATGLTWMQADSGEGLLWGDALAYCDALSLAGADDWRLPDAKELHSIVDYSRSPDVTNSAAIDPIFAATPITNEAGQPDYASYWSSTTHVAYPSRLDNAVYIAFGRGLGNMSEFGGWIDVHGAGAQRSDPKAGVSEQDAAGRGPQGDAIRAFNYVRCVRGGDVQPSAGADPATLNLPSNGATQPPADDGQGNPPADAPPSDGPPAGDPPSDGHQGQGNPPADGPPQDGPPGQGDPPPDGPPPGGQGNPPPGR